ncbi:MAG TPA: hypothetical protein ENG05_02990 [Acidilobales archaeon]|nr:hypothetical protein [Acidilobales archaeon]
MVNLKSILEIEPEIRSMGIFVAITLCTNVRVIGNDLTLLTYLRRISKNISESYDLERLKEHPLIRAYRSTMWKLGIDPTKVRPSSEALIRRLLRKGSIPSINNVVDACNIASIETLVPISVFDFSKIHLPLHMRYSLSGEEFIDISGKLRILKSKEVVLVDNKNNILHLYPHRDSKISAVGKDTTKVLAIGYGAADVPRIVVSKALRRFIELLSLSLRDVKCKEPVIVG